MAGRDIKPPATLAPRPCDEELTVEELKHISLFAKLDLDRLKIEELPGTIVLRRYGKGEEICRQNDPGYTAFYPLTAKDLLDLRASQLKSAADRQDAQRIRELEPQINELKTRQASAAEFPQVASAYRDAPAPERTGLWKVVKRVAGRLGGHGTASRPAGQGILVEGQLFGEMSCLYRTPRTTTVVAERDCYMLEFLRNILDKMYGNKAFKEQLDALYRARVVGLLLRKLPLFARLPDAQVQSLRDRVELVEFEPGDLICAEHQRSDALYVVRSGYVKVVKNASALLGVEAITDWPRLCKALCAGDQEAAGPRRKVWSLLPAPVQAALRKGADSGALMPSEKEGIVYALNDLLKDPKLRSAAEFKEVPAGSGWDPDTRKAPWPGNVRKWSPHRRVCTFNRHLLAHVLAGALPPPSDDDGRILAYCSEGDALGEIGLALDRPRGATCVAYDHYGEGKLINGRVELVRIGKELFQELRQASPELEEEITRVVRRRTEANEVRMRLPPWEQDNVASLSERFEELGLIQGQKLMLIDLDRCTRCDKCVEACVGSHSPGLLSRLVPGTMPAPHLDGRSRLFLDGPRFHYFDGAEVKHYLVPSTCRQCKDPVCLVGCPVGSIHKGDNRQIVIENWCIGCGRCAEQCPYGSIQMHTIGLVPRRTRGWFCSRGPDGPWEETLAPCVYDRDLQARHPHLQEIYFRRAFPLAAVVAADSKSFQVNVQSVAPELTVQINGQAVLLRSVKGSDKQEKWNLQAQLALAGGPSPPAAATADEAAPFPVLRLGNNIIVVRARPTANAGDVLLDLGLYALGKPSVAGSLADDVNQELVMKTAVVCDLCSEQAGQQPACVNACPHDAALRVEAGTFFKVTTG